MVKKSGTFIISLDFELLWGLSGWPDHQIRKYIQNINGAKNALKCILDVFTRYNIKCSIAFVGGMNHETPTEFWKEAPVHRPHYTNRLFSSYESLLSKEGSLYSSDQLFCKDLISMLINNPRVELATHTFSHYYCMENGQTGETFKADLTAAIANAKKSSINLQTIIFPRNQVSSAYLKECSLLGITHYRGNLESYLYRSEQTPKRYSLRRALRLLDVYLNISGYNCYSAPSKVEGLTNVPSSRFFRPYSTKLSILEPLKIHRIKRSMKYAANNGLIYHLWWHPHNFGNNIDKNIDQLDKICQYYIHLKDYYKMDNNWICEL